MRVGSFIKIINNPIIKGFAEASRKKKNKMRKILRNIQIIFCYIIFFKKVL